MSDSVDRRDFLKKATSVGVSLGMAGAAFAKGGKASASRVLGANDRINVGVIGYGGRGEYVARAFDAYGQKNNNCLQILHVCDVWEAARRWASTSTSAKATSTSAKW